MGEPDGADIREGGCACGQARFRASGGPIFVNNCHCRLCQRQTGGTSVVNAFYESERIELLQGKLTAHVVVAGSGGEHTIHRCENCGTALWSVYPRLGTLGFGVRVGTFDDPTAFRPDAAIFMESAMPWVTPPEGVPAFAQTYAPQELLPPERLARLMAMIERRKAGEG